MSYIIFLTIFSFCFAYSDTCSDLSDQFIHMDRLNLFNSLSDASKLINYYKSVITHVHNLALCSNTIYHEIFVSPNVRVNICSGDNDIIKYFRAIRGYNNAHLHCPGDVGINAFTKYFYDVTKFENIKEILILNPIEITERHAIVESVITESSGNNTKIKSTFEFDKYGRINFVYNYLI